MPFRPIFLLPLAAAAILRAQEPLNRPVPLLAATTAPSAGENALAREAARRAQELGFPGLAVSLYRQLLQAEPPEAPPADRTDLTLALATALLDDNPPGAPAEAEQALQGIPAPRGAAWHLREGLAEARQGRLDRARVESAAIRPEDLSPEDRPWHFFLQGMLVGPADPLRAGDLYSQAERAATSELSRARFFLAHEQALMQVGQVTEAMAEQTRQNAEQVRGTEVGYEFERHYAVLLDALGQKSAAVEALTSDLVSLPAGERRRADDFRLLLGLIAGAGDGVGRQALVQLLATGADPERQRVALELLRQASQREPERGAFRAELGQLIDALPPHPILDDLLFFRADLELGDQPPDYTQAEADARELLNKFPGSQLKSHALGILAASAWEQLRYHTAEDAAAKALEELPAGEARKELGLLVAEAWFRAGVLAGDNVDFRHAADAYAAVLRSPPANVAPGELMFQRVEAESKAESLPAAQTVLDQFASDPAFDATDRWKAEWNLALALQVAGQTDAAYARVSRLLATASLPPAPGGAELRARMAWLQAQLSFDTRQYGRTLELVDALDSHLGGVPALKDELQSTDALLRARAYFALHQEDEGIKTLEQLRTDHADTPAAVHSYLIAADHYAQQDNSVEAQRLYIKLAETFPKSPDAPFALYQAALQAEHQGQQSDLDEARVLIERLATRYPDNPLVFDARLTEGNLLRTLNELPQAQEVYESLRNDPRYLHRRDFVYVLLALAECDDAQSASDVGHVENARALFEDLCDRMDAPADVRVEAGYNLGHLLAQHDHVDEALTTWWQDVVTPFLLEGKSAALLGANGRYWMTRTLIELGERYAGLGRQEQAKQMWRLILEAKLPGAELAEEDIARLNNPAPKP
jgi:cellulose synthase operon protein C